MTDMRMLRFRATVEELGRIRGRHTELVTVYVPDGYNVLKAVEQLRNEQSTAQNIKSKQVRKNVLAALEKILQHLKEYRQTPDKGLALFCGNVSPKEGVADIQLIVVEPPEALHVRLYQCDQRFVVEPLLEMVEEKEVYGLIVLDKSEADLGLLKGKRIEALKHMESIVPGKTKKGGWSANRYARIREGLLEDFLKSVGAVASEQFREMKNLKGVIIGGPGPIKEQFLEAEYLNYEVKKKVLGVVNTSYTGTPGLEELVTRSEDVIAEAAAVKEGKLLERFFTELAKDSGLAVYGEATAERLAQGMVDILLLSEALYKDQPERCEQLMRQAEQMGTTVEIISKDSPKGQQLRELGGIGGLLRYRG